MPFTADIRHWPDVAAFTAHLAQHDPTICAWVQGLTYHHTIIPTPAQWRGRATMQGLRDFYAGRGWDAGPHLFIAPDGIWQLTPLSVPGIHAGRCNADHWGIEVCGDYDAAPWPADLADLAYGAGEALLRWRGLTVTDTSVTGHRECLPNKSCPGTAIQLPAVRAELTRRLAATPPPVAAVSRDAPLLAAPRCTQAQALAYLTRRTPGGYTRADVALSMLPAYWEACTATGLDPCVAIAQLIHETGALTSWWVQRPRRNPAGIGVTGRTQARRPARGAWAWDGQTWAEGCSFASWANDAVPAHVGRLLAYARPDSIAHDTQRQVIAQALAVRALPTHYRGCAPTLAGLEGTWAVPGVGYADALAAIMQEVSAQ